MYSSWRDGALLYSSIWCFCLLWCWTGYKSISKGWSVISHPGTVARISSEHPIWCSWQLHVTDACGTPTCFLYKRKLLQLGAACTQDLLVTFSVFIFYVFSPYFDCFYIQNSLKDLYNMRDWFYTCGIHLLPSGESLQWLYCWRLTLI